MNKKDLKAYFTKLGKKGGTNRMKGLTKKQKSDLSKKALSARWKK